MGTLHVLLQPPLLQRSCRAPRFCGATWGGSFYKHQQCGTPAVIHCPTEKENPQMSLGFAAPLGTSPGQLLLGECDIPLPTACPSLVLCCLVVVFPFQAKGRSSPSIAWCPRNTPSFPDLPLVLVPDFHLLSPALSLSRPTAFTQWHTCKCCFDG